MFRTLGSLGIIGRMKSMVILASAIACLLLSTAVAFNRMVRLRNRVRRAWTDVDVQLRLRHQLIPLLVQSVKGYAEQERAVLEKAALARREALAAEETLVRGRREETLSAALREVLLLGERHPGLRADDSFSRLAEEIVAAENDLAAARKYYNGSVRAYNTFIQSFPMNLLAAALRFRPAEYFQEEDDAP